MHIVLQINLRLILVSGKTKEFIFSPNDSAGDIAQAIFDNWPEGKDFLFYLQICNYNIKISSKHHDNISLCVLFKFIEIL